MGFHSVKINSFEELEGSITRKLGCEVLAEIISLCGSHS